MKKILFAITFGLASFAFCIETIDSYVEFSAEYSASAEMEIELEDSEAKGKEIKSGIDEWNDEFSISHFRLDENKIQHKLSFIYRNFQVNTGDYCLNSLPPPESIKFG